MADDQTASNAGSAPLSKGVIGGVAAAGAGVFLLLLCIIVLILRARRNHKRRLADLESRGAGLSRGPSIAEITDVGTHRTRTVLRRNTNFVPYGNNNSGWDSLHSNDSWHTDRVQGVPGSSNPPVVPLSTLQTVQNCDTSVSRTSFPWLFGRRSSTKRTKRPAPVSRLSAITEAFCESPRSQQLTALPIIPDPDEDVFSHHAANKPNDDAYNARERGSGLSRTEHGRPSSPLLEIPALPAMKPAITINDHNGADTIRVVQASRSKSMAYLPSSEYEQSVSRKRPVMHKRSVSLCTQKSGQVPIGPAPPLPVFLSAAQKRNSLLQVSPSRLSVSSIGSGGSSVLIHSPDPGLKRTRSGNFLGITDHDWPLVPNGLRPMRASGTSFHSSPGPRRYHTVSSRSSIRSSVARCSGASFDLKLQRANSAASGLPAHNRFSATGSDMGERPGLVSEPSMASIPESLHSPSSRRSSRFFVDAKGSPVARFRSPALPDVADPISTSDIFSQSPSPDKHAFTFEPSPMRAGTKPSALKGSPNGRKGHRRQNCVRIQLAPTILGPSPPHMKQIDEEDSSPNSDVLASFARRDGLGIHSDPIRPPLVHRFGSNLRRPSSSQRSSLVASSSTMSLANFCQDNGLPLDQLGLIPGLKPLRPLTSRTGQINPSRSIPAFPLMGNGLGNRSCSVSMPHLTSKAGPSAPSSPNEERGEDSLPDAGHGSAPVDTTAGADPEESMDDIMSAFLSLSSDDSKTSGQIGVATAIELHSSPPAVQKAGLTPGSDLQHETERASRSSSPVSPKSQPGMFTFGASLPVTEPVDIPWTFSPVKHVMELSSSAMAEPPTPDSASSSRTPSRSTAVGGPRAPPAPPLGKAVQMLRRMNSDVGLIHGAERRYLGLCHSNTSPGLPNGIYRDSYADFTRVREPSVEDLGKKALERSNSSMPVIGLGILGEDLGEELEIDIDEMLGSSVYGSGRKPALENRVDLSWLDDASEEDLWDREDLNEPSPLQKDLGSPSKNDLFADMPQFSAGAQDNRSFDVWESGEKFWEMQESPSPSTAATEETKVSPSTTKRKVSSIISEESCFIPGLSLTTATSPSLPIGIDCSESGNEGDRVGARSSWGSSTISMKKRRGTERSSSIRKSAILNLSSSAHNRQKAPNASQVDVDSRAARSTPEPDNVLVVKGQGTPGSLYDEDGFLKIF